jgi:predicted GIY-YIG superfamily endonuclease
MVDPPAKLVRSERFDTYTEARLREVLVKHWSRAKKEALVEGNSVTLRTLAKSTHSTAPPKARGHAQG